MSKYSCPCCGYLVYEENPSGSYEVCPVCYWEYDDIQNENEYTYIPNEDKTIQGNIKYITKKDIVDMKVFR